MNLQSEFFFEDNQTRKCELIINFAAAPCWVISGWGQQRKHAASLRSKPERWTTGGSGRNRLLEGNYVWHLAEWIKWFLRWQLRWNKDTSTSRIFGVWLLIKRNIWPIRGWHLSPAGLTRLPPSLAPGSAWLLASQRREEMVLFPNTNYFLPPTTCSVGALLSLPDSLIAEPPWAWS